MRREGDCGRWTLDVTGRLEKTTRRVRATRRVKEASEGN